MACKIQNESNNKDFNTLLSFGVSSAPIGQIKEAENLLRFI